MSKFDILESYKKIEDDVDKWKIILTMGYHDEANNSE